MGCCSWRQFVLIICVLQVIATLQRLVFDFMGYMWGSITANIVNLIVVIVGIVGAYQYRGKVLLLYAVWCTLWIGWNALVICIYLKIGLFENKNYGVLDFGTDQKSFWFNYGIGCETEKQVSTPNLSSTLTTESAKGASGCILSYDYVEVIHAGVQVLLALMGFVSGIRLACLYMEEDDSSVSAQEELEFIKMPNRTSRRSPPPTHLPYSSLQQSNTSSSGFTDLTICTGDNNTRRASRKPHSPSKDRPQARPRRPQSNYLASNGRSQPAYENAESLRHQNQHNADCLPAQPPPYQFPGPPPGTTVI
ncbi:DgyrCDS9070 [Dimorphilus gyrociliatus]|uniref:Sodium/potassium-transporting ATPase subunit beta-1-interacting protein n=1 Tax=Dimorphilus gyrociliatus TaxID=2664684 RepID=A0A7I8VWC0_9ANNE|nr:DgyrCDS9070 [Dimorphilus gyrociliatus]